MDQDRAFVYVFIVNQGRVSKYVVKVYQNTLLAYVVVVTKAEFKVCCHSGPRQFQSMSLQWTKAEFSEYVVIVEQGRVQSFVIVVQDSFKVCRQSELKPSFKVCRYSGPRQRFQSMSSKCKKTDF